MPLFKNDDGDYVLKPRTPGYEAVAVTGLTPVDLTGDGNSLGFDSGLEYGFGGVLTVAIYAGLMRYLELVPAHRAGALAGGQQTLVREAMAAAWQETKNKTVYVLAVAVIIGLLPGTAGIFAVAGLFGAGVAAVRLTRQFMTALSEEQVEALRNAAATAGVNVPGLDNAGPTKADDAGDEPLPTFA